MVINRYGEHLLGVVLSDDILIKKFFDFLRLQQVDSAEIRSFFLIGKFLFQNLRAEFDTVIADIYIICASDQFSNLILCLAANEQRILSSVLPGILPPCSFLLFHPEI